MTWFCFLFPLIQPDWQISRIRLSEKIPEVTCEAVCNLVNFRNRLLEALERAGLVCRVHQARCHIPSIGAVDLHPRIVTLVQFK